MKKILEITEWENRSGRSKPSEMFGYVYFSDNTRVGFSPHTDGPPVWHARTNGGGEPSPTSQRHINMATKMLKAEGVL